MFTLLYVEMDGSVGTLAFHDEQSAKEAQTFLNTLTKGVIVITETDDDDD